MVLFYLGVWENAFCEGVWIFVMSNFRSLCLLVTASKNSFEIFNLACSKMSMFPNWLNMWLFEWKEINEVILYFFITSWHLWICFINFLPPNVVIFSLQSCILPLVMGLWVCLICFSRNIFICVPKLFQIVGIACFWSLVWISSKLMHQRSYVAK